MSKTATVYLNAQVEGDGINPFNLVPTFISNTNSPLVSSIVALTNGDVLVTPPSNAQIAVLVPIENAVVAKTIKGATTDVGITISTNNPAVIPLPASPNGFYIASTASEDLNVYFF